MLLIHWATAMNMKMFAYSSQYSHKSKINRQQMHIIYLDGESLPLLIYCPMHGKVKK